jgi:hypothetical protein
MEEDFALHVTSLNPILRYTGFLVHRVQDSKSPLSPHLAVVPKLRGIAFTFRLLKHCLSSALYVLDVCIWRNEIFECFTLEFDWVVRQNCVAVGEELSDIINHSRSNLKNF